jgi:AraC-like DNA-binding protein/quercetin dioxygenase-like cupin family protein
MTIDEIILELSAKKDNIPVEKVNILLSKSEPFHVGPFTVYPNRSRNVNNLASIVVTTTSADSPYISFFSSNMPRRIFSEDRIEFEEGSQSEPHEDNYVEFDFVAKGQSHIWIEGRDYIFNQGDLSFINSNTTHAEYGHRRDMALISLLISNSFFDKTMRPDIPGRETGNLLRRFIVDRKDNFFFIRFTPKNGPSQIPPFFEYICTEFLRPQPGGNHLIIGFVERFLNALFHEYRYVVEWNDHGRSREKEFEEVTAYLEEHYAQVTLEKLIGKFGHGINYYNKLIKSHTGQSYVEYLQNIRLERAEQFLVTTQFPVEEIAYRVGYKDPSHFYKIFYKKYQTNPKEIRTQAGRVSLSGEL